MNNENEPRSRKSSPSHVKKRDPKLRKRICWTLLALTLIVFWGVGTRSIHMIKSTQPTRSVVSQLRSKRSKIHLIFRSITTC